MNDWPSYLGKNNRKDSYGRAPVRTFVSLWVLIMLVNIAVWIGGIVVAVHFIRKYW